ncbi:MAG: SDR family oxidoreductase [Sphingomonadaceae bacterium]
MEEYKANSDNRPSVLITGGAKRLGAAITQTFAEAGWHVIIHCHHSRKEADRLAAKFACVEVVQCDLGESDQAIRMIRDLAQNLPDWRVLINNASLFLHDDARRLDPQIFHQVMDINAAAPARISQEFLACARSRRGRTLIHLTDQKLQNPNPDFFSYTMSKYALSSTIPMLAMGAAHDTDRIYGLAPGAILPSHDQSPEEANISHRMNILGRRTGASEIGDAALFLAQGVLANGQTLFVDSGQHLLKQKRDVIFLARS